MRKPSVIVSCLLLMLYAIACDLLAGLTVMVFGLPPESNPLGESLLLWMVAAFYIHGAREREWRRDAEGRGSGER